jgi:hypothetical protein
MIQKAGAPQTPSDFVEPRTPSSGETVALPPGCAQAGRMRRPPLTELTQLAPALPKL